MNTWSSHWFKSIILPTVVALLAMGCHLWPPVPGDDQDCDPPVITQQPVGQNRLLIGQNTSFSVEATGTGTLSYQWRLNGQPIQDNERFQGTQSPTLAITNVQVDIGGNYDCIVTDDCGSTQSEYGILIAWVVNLPE